MSYVYIWMIASLMRFQMTLQIACPRRSMVSFLLFTVLFQMSPQGSCLRTCIVTLVAFVWLFPTVRSQMCPQIACTRRDKVTFVIVWLFSTVRFQMSLQIACPRRGIVTLVAFIWFNDIVGRFLQDFYICVFWAEMINFHLIYCQCVLYFAQIVTCFHFWLQ